AVAGEDVEAEQRDRVHQHQRELESAVVADQEWQRASHRQQEEDQENIPLHTRVTCTLPKKPDGRTSSTPTMSTSATDSLSSLPMTNAPSTFSSTPTRKPPSTAPPGLSMPPTSAAANAYSSTPLIMFGSRYTIGATIMPATAPIAAASPPSVMPIAPISCGDMYLNAACGGNGLGNDLRV